MAKLIDMLTSALAPLDAEVREASKKWAVERLAAIRTFKYADAPNRGSSEWYAQLFSIAGGKTWFNLLDGRSSEDAADVAARNADGIARKRNATIAAKLTKAGVDEVEGAEFARTEDGFNGLFVVNTPTGQKSVRIETIYAGGYNIQCLHLRVLVTVR